MADKITSLQLVSRSRAKIAYYAALLAVFRLLIVKGFFQEPEFRFLESNNERDRLNEVAEEEAEAVTRTTRGSIQHQMAAIGGYLSLSTNENNGGEAGDNPSGPDAFTLQTVKRMLVEKLNHVVLAHKCTKDFDEISHYDDVLENEKHDQLRGKVQEPSPTSPGGSSINIHGANRSAKRFRHKRRKIKKAVDIEVSKDIAAKICRTRKVFDKVRDNFAFFEVLFADKTMADVMHSAIDILTHIHDIEQMLRLSKCWNYVNKAKVVMTERAYAEDTLALESYLPHLHLDKFLHKVFDGFQCSEAVPGYTDAIFSATLYDDHALRWDSYELLDRQLSLVRDAQHTYEHITLVGSGHRAFLYRLVTVYEEQMVGYMRQILAQPSPTNAYLLERLTFSIENLRALHFSSFLDRLDPTVSSSGCAWTSLRLNDDF